MCIDQENNTQKLQQIRRMGDIYRGAYASIIALSGSSMDSGLSRFRTSTEGNAQPQVSCHVKDKKLIGLMPTLSQQTHNTSWGSRAWTLQEALLSCRCIYFSKHQVYFECNAMQCSESLDDRNSWIHQSHRGDAEVDGGLDPDTYGVGTLRNAHAGKGKPKDPLQVYGVLATLYSYRHMTYSSDALHAFSAVLQHLQQLAYEDGFFWGLPEADLNWSLLWCSQSPLTRRSGFPSWSWTGWKGAVFPGWPTDIFDTQKFWTPFFAWKSQGKQLIPVFPHNPLPGPGSFDTALFHQRTVFDTVSEQAVDNGFVLERFPNAEREGYLFIDCAVCCFDFTFGDDRSTLQTGPHVFHDVDVNSVSCYIRSVRGTLNHCHGQKLSLTNLALVAREIQNELVYHHFVQFDLQNDGIAVRNDIFALLVPRD